MSEQLAGASSAPEQALAEHFFRAACVWAEQDGEPVEALVFDRWLVAAQDWLDRPRLVPCRCPWCLRGMTRHRKVPIGTRWDGFGGRGVVQIEPGSDRG